MRTHRLLERIGNKLQLWLVTARRRRELRNLSDGILKDIGLSRVDAERTANRPFWQESIESDDTLKRRAAPAGSGTIDHTCGLQDFRGTVNRCGSGG